MGNSVLLVSGISVRRTSSFRLQLELLQQGLAGHGIRGTIFGIGAAGGTNDLPTLDRERHMTLIRRTGADATILLGYSAQFPILTEEPAVPCFLWAQASQTPRSEIPDATAVPLTGMTRRYLTEAGWRLGPTIPHGVDSELLAPMPATGSAADCVAFLSVGANSTRKRFDRLVDAFNGARAELEKRGLAARLTIKTDRTVAAAGFDLNRLCRPSTDRGIQVIAGELTAQQLSDLYRAHDVYVHAAEWEGFGIPVAEASACGLPVICPTGQGPAELLPYAETLVPAAHADPEVPESVRLVDTAALASMMVRLALDPPLRQILGECGRRHACKHFASDNVASAWAGILYR